MKMHDEMLHAAARIASERDITLGQMIRDLLAREIARAQNARPPVRADERLVAPLRARLAGDLAEAGDWQDLQARLRSKGYVLRAAGGGLALHDWPADRRICKASELGFSYSRLMRRFHTPFPGHGHRWLFDRISAAEKTQTGASEDAPDDSVIEGSGNDD
ncbi:hypothetical protein SAMN04487859_104146 [Roseovarius lutimaris]|uniref:Uncharacterized protein n=1 Tax=Roseovarius lutimaris TaxID=1005928 RepID=A0A1I4ZVC9_9RHOB|nr:hypothetical protein [Roseovarius lutimaris]SFN54171.1 hypothetical protein SAMN04487859_104146 [Roseovarius lutimaris]